MLWSVLANVPGKTVAIQRIHEGIWVKLFHIEYAMPTPFACYHQQGTDHCWHSGCIRDSLGAHFLPTVSVVTNIVDKDLAGLSVFRSHDFAANARFPLIPSAETGWIRQKSF